MGMGREPDKTVMIYDESLMAEVANLVKPEIPEFMEIIGINVDFLCRFKKQVQEETDGDSCRESE